MILTVDVGNTQINIGGYREDRQLFVSKLGTDCSKSEDEYAVLLLSVLELYGFGREDLSGAIISSVVPPLLSVIKRAIRKVRGDVRVLTVGPGIKTGLNIRIDNPAQLGTDLVCMSVSLLAKYPMPAIVVDLGTATTISALNRNGCYIGSSIAPGIRLGLDALTAGTAQLPQIGLETPVPVIGTNTVDSMKSGVILGGASMLDGMIERYRQILGEDLTVVVTGALAKTVAPHCRERYPVDESLLLDGLYHLYKKNTKSDGRNDPSGK